LISDRTAIFFSKNSAIKNKIGENMSEENMISVVATIRAKAGKENIVKQELLRLVEPSRAEAGCLNYDLHQGLEDPALFIFYENWQDLAALERHREQPHLAASQKTLEGCVESRQVLLLKRTNLPS
jgi:quinol monooxygenase YgiN